MVCSRENEPQNNLLLASRFYLVSIFRYFSKYDTKFSLSLDVVVAADDVQSRSRSWHVFPVITDDAVSVSSSISCKQKYSTLLVLQSKMQSFFKPFRHFKVILQLPWKKVISWGSEYQAARYSKSSEQQMGMGIRIMWVM